MSVVSHKDKTSSLPGSKKKKSKLSKALSRLNTSVLCNFMTLVRITIYYSPLVLVPLLPIYSGDTRKLQTLLVYLIITIVLTTGLLVSNPKLEIKPSTFKSWLRFGLAVSTIINILFITVDFTNNFTAVMNINHSMIYVWQILLHLLYRKLLFNKFFQLW